MSKRKRGSSGRQEVVVDLTDESDEEPVAKTGRSTPRGQGSRTSTRVGHVDQQTVVAGPSRRLQVQNDQHRFDMPAPPVPSTSKIRRVSDDPSPEQERRTISCRQMRTAVIRVISDFHDDLKQQRKADSSDLVKNLWICWKKYPLMFAHASKILKLPVEDLSSSSEIQEFLPWWLHGLSSLLFFRELQPYRNDLKELLKTISQFLIYGNPELVEVCFLELLKVLVEFSQPVRRAMTLTLGNEDGNGSVGKLDIVFRLDENDEDSIADFLDILRLFLPRVCYFKVVQRQTFLIVLRNLWTRLNDRSKFKLFSTFLIPVMPLLPSSPITTENTTTRFLAEIINTGLRFSDSPSVSSFVVFCDLMWKGVIPMGLLPDTFLLKLHSWISKLIVCEKFNTIPTDAQRKGIVKLYLSLTGKSSKIYEREKLRGNDMKLFLKAAETWPSIEISHPLLEETVMTALKAAFVARTSADVVTNPVVNWNGRDIRKIQISSNETKLWGKIVDEFESAISSTVENISTSVEALQKSCLTIQLAGKLNYRLLEYVQALNSESNKGVLWKPDFELLSINQMERWTTLAENCILQSLRENSGSTDKVFALILDSIDAFEEGNFLFLCPSVDLSCQWVSIAGIPLLMSSILKPRLPKEFNPTAFIYELSCFNFKLNDNLLSDCTRARCLKTLRLEMFLPWKDLVFYIITNILENSIDKKFVSVLLSMIGSYSWTIRNIPWTYLVGYLHKILYNVDWRNDSQIRNKLVQAIVVLPCIYSNQKQKIATLNPSDRLKLEIRECFLCKGSKANTSQNISENHFIPGKEITVLIRLSLPILESHFLMAKLEISKLISSIRTHSKEFSKELVAAFTTTAARGSVSLGTEMMKHMCFYLRSEQQQFDKNRNFGRSEAIEIFFYTLGKRLEYARTKQKFVRFSIKTLIILQQLAINADQLMMVEILKFVLRILAIRDSNVINMLSQGLVGVLASKSGCLSWELMTRVRYELAEEMLVLMINHCCDLNEPDTDMWAERCRAFFSSICTMGEFRTAGIFIHHFYPILLGYMVPTLSEDKQIQFIFKVMTDFAPFTASQILHDGFHNYYRALVLGHTADKVGKSFVFLKNRHGLDPNVVAFSVLQGTLNEMLCHLHDRKERVVKCVPQLLRRDGSGVNADGVIAKPVGRSEIQELISNYLMGFFVFVDTKLHSRLESITSKRRILQSFTVLIELMGKTRMTANRTKVYATLNSLFSLGLDFYDLLYEAWKTFSLNLESVAFGQMSAQILAAVIVLKETVPKQVDSLISQFVVSKKELTRPYHQELYFLLDHTNDSHVQKIIFDCVSKLRSTSWGSYFELLVKESANENSHIRYRAIKKLHDVLIKEYESLHQKILEQEHPVVSQVLNSFLNASRDADNEMLMLLAESFGALGAVDPFRFKDAEGDELKRKSMPTFTVTGPNFAAKFLDLLVREFQESEDTTDFDYCACLIQQVLKHFNVKAIESDHVWCSMSVATRQLVEPLLTSKYKVEKELPKPDMRCPIYLSENGKSFDRWLSNWLSLMITYVREGTQAFELFKFTKYMIPRNNRIASFLLPYVATFAVIGGNERQKRDIVMEIENILQKWIDQDALKVNSQIMMPVKDNQTELGTPEMETKMICDEDVFQYRCTQEIFSVFDHLFRGVRHAKRQAGLVRANNRSSRSARPDPINPSLTEENAEIITRVLSEIPMNTVSQVAFHCEDYTRALFYVEQDLNRTPEKLQDSLNYLQQLYVSLNDMDSVIGVSAIRKREPNTSENILENIAKGRMEVAVRSLECMASADPNDLIAHNGLLKAYLSMDEPRKAETLVKGCISRNPQWEMALNEAQIEASWKLRDWSSLQTQITKTLSGPSDTPVSWNMTIVKLLSFVKDLQLDKAFRILKEARVKLMSPLVAAANDCNAYARGYPNVVQLHILTEVEQVINILKTRSDEVISAEDSIKSLNSEWDARLSILLKSQKFVDPVLDVRRTLLEMLKESIFPDQATVSLIDGSIRDCWLKVATVESKAGNFTRASNCLAEAKKFMSAKVMIENAKLLSRKGEKEQAIRVLNSGMISYFPQVNEWKRLANISQETVNEERKLCSNALLLHAKLCDEQQLLDFEENIKNYKSSTEVFRESEKNFYTLASYYDRMWGNKEDKSRQSDIQALLVRYYAQSLHYGCKYVYQSLPRLLSIWFDYSAIGFSMSGNAANSYQDSPPQEFSMTVSQMQDTIKNVVREVPTYVLLTAFSQLISRICHGNPSVWELLKEIIGSIICNHPHQALWMTMAVSKSSYVMRQVRCKEIYKSVERKKPVLKKTIEHYTLLADHLIAVCVKEVGTSGTHFQMANINKHLPKFVSSSTFSDVLIPFQVFLSPSLPLKGAGHKFHNAFPQKLVFIKGVKDEVTVMASLQKPKKINIIGSNGKIYGLLCKARDDLRKDCKVMEVNNVVNWYLHRNPESRQRQLHVRMYAVSPLNEEHGLLEWVPDLSGFRGSLISLYRDRGITLNMREIKSVLHKGDPIETQRTKFTNKLIKPHPPVFSEWFLNNFNDPQSWYKARLAYTRTAAVMSIVGFVLGLGDRHGENILMDSTTGDIIHVDFNCLFNKGDTFDYPERVPFRLTQNMVEAMGPLGVEGVFRRSCEITMSMIREHKSIFLSVIHPFVFDPLVEWGNSGRPSTFTGEMTNGKAVEHMKHINNRMDGSARNGTKEKNTELSVEAQVAYLIEEARSIDNLCRMYIGWTAFF